MRIILSGYSGSKQILPASSFLVKKYLPGFDVTWLNYGAAPEGLSCGTYVSLADKQASVRAWAKDLSGYLRLLPDQFIVFALDDYLLSEPLRCEQYHRVFERMDRASNVCGRLCTSSFYKPREIAETDGEIIVLNNKAEYSATTQYCIWRTEFLIQLLGKISTPWEFEVEGSRYLNSSGYKVIGSTPPALVYNDNSSLSARWTGIDVKGVQAPDLAEMLGLGLLCKEDLRIQDSGNGS